MDEPRVGLFPAMYLGAILGVIATIPASLIAIVSAGGGHGSDAPASLLYPYPLLLWKQTGGPLTWDCVYMALGQFPIYGLFLGYLAARPRQRLPGFLVICIALMHFLAVFACFSGPD